MARKAVPQEECFFCHTFPCSCQTVSRNKLLRQKLQPDEPGVTDEPTTDRDEAADER